jgi:hypothetical protein
VQLPQTGHSCIAQHFLPLSVCSADKGAVDEALNRFGFHQSGRAITIFELQIPGSDQTNA